MIKKIKLQNIFGISKPIEFDFELKYLKESQLNYEDGITSENDSKIMLTPTFIAKNASGKTSILKAIYFAYKINSINDIYEIFLEKYYEELEKLKHEIQFSLIRAINFVIGFERKDTIFNNYDDNKKDKILKLILKNFISFYTGRYFFDKDKEFQKGKNLQENINNLFEKQKKYLINVFRYSVKNFPGENLKKNIVFAHKKDMPILLEIIYSNDKSKKIKIGNEIVFNDEKRNFNKWKKDFEIQISLGNWWDSSYNLINSILDYLNRTITFKKLKEKFKEFDIYKSKKNNEKIDNLEAFFIDDFLIRKIDSSETSKCRNEKHIHCCWIKEDLLGDLIDFFSFNFINKLLCELDISISHIAKQKNDAYAIWDTNKEIKEIDTLSFGILRTLFILHKMGKAFSGKDNNIILLDEIENGLNISLINLIISIITNQNINKNNTQIFITTHIPNVFTQKIINPQCAFIYQNNKFIRAGSDNGIIKRTEDLIKIFMPKNYYNPIFWKSLISSKNIEKLDVVKTDSIGNSKIFELIDVLESNNEDN